MALPDAGVSTRVVQPIVAGLMMLGADPAAALEQVGLDPKALADPDGRVPHARVAALWEHAAELTGAPDFGLRVVEHMDLSVFDVQTYAYLSSANLRAGVKRVERYHRLNHDVAQVGLLTTADAALYRHTLPGAHRLPAAAAQFILGSAIKLAQTAAGGALLIREVRFQHPRPGDEAALVTYARVLATPVAFEQPYNEVVFPISALDTPHVRADPGLSAVLDRHAEELLAALPRVSSLADRARAEIARQLPGGIPSAEHVAARLGMSARTLARRLAEEQTSHKALLDDLRAQLARRHLADPQRSIGEVAFLLGFSEPSAFHRAFKRWTGRTPASFRREG